MQLAQVKEHIPVPPGGIIDIKVQVPCPPEFVKLASKIDAGIDHMLSAQWWDGYWHGGITVGLILVITFLLAWVLKKK